MAQATISLRTVVVQAQDQVLAELDDEAVILNLKTGVYFGLNRVGASIWNLLKTPRSVAEIRDAMVAEYEVEPQAAEQDLLKLLKELLSRGLIEISAGRNP
jgi:hypothetical protein